MWRGIGYVIEERNREKNKPIHFHIDKYPFLSISLTPHLPTCHSSFLFAIFVMSSLLCAIFVMSLFLFAIFVMPSLLCAIFVMSSLLFDIIHKISFLSVSLIKPSATCRSLTHIIPYSFFLLISRFPTHFPFVPVPHSTVLFLPS